jgi:CheY-like chemotaxis protein
MKKLNNKTWKILIVEDVPEYNNLIKAKLGLLNLDHGILTNIVQVSSAKEAKKKLKKDITFDMFLLDVKMETDKAGLDLTDFIKNDLNLAAKIIIITGEPNITEKDVFDKHEIESFIYKIDFDRDFEHKFIDKLKEWNKEFTIKQQDIKEIEKEHNISISELMAYLKWKHNKDPEFLIWVYNFAKIKGYKKSYEDFLKRGDYLFWQDKYLKDRYGLN